MAAHSRESDARGRAGCRRRTQDAGRRMQDAAGEYLEADGYCSSACTLD